VAPEICKAGIGGFSAQLGHHAASEEKSLVRRPRRHHSPAFQTKVAVTVIKGESTLIELAQDFDVQQNQIKQWQAKLRRASRNRWST